MPAQVYNFAELRELHALREALATQQDMIRLLEHNGGERVDR